MPPPKSWPTVTPMVLAGVATETRMLDAGQHRLGTGSLDYRPGFIADDGAWLARLERELTWERHRVRIFGREHLTPRGCAWHGDPGAVYHYSGNELLPQAWTPGLQELRQQVEAAAGTRFNSVLCNRYADGSQSMGWHSDDEADLGPDPTIASLSLGSARRFLLRHRHDAQQPRLECPLGNGDLLVMAGTLQRDWQHQVPKTAKPVGLRINLTFRTIVG